MVFFLGRENSFQQKQMAYSRRAQRYKQSGQSTHGPAQTTVNYTYLDAESYPNNKGV